MSWKHYSDYDAPGAAEEFEAEHFGNELGYYLHSSELERIRALLPPEPCSVLDVGTGTGRLAIPLAASGASVTGVDASREMLALAQSRAKDESNPNFIHGDAHALPFGDAQFDHVISIRAIMHFDLWHDVVGELCRVARRTVIVDAPSTFGAPILEVAFDRLRRLCGSTVKPYHTFTVRKLERAFAEHGFQVQHVKKQYLFPIKLHRRIDMLRLSLAIEGGFRRLGVTRVFGSPILVVAERVPA